jgi:DNA-binding MarR family transcriptional regulator
VSSSAPALDLAQTLSLLGARVDDHVLSTLREAGMTGLRPGHGYFVQRLLVGPATASDMARSLGISQQAASKAVRELVDLGYAEFTTDDTDRRRKATTLTDRGREAIELTRATRAEVHERVRRAVGADRFETALGVLAEAMSLLGLDEAVRARQVRPPATQS